MSTIAFGSTQISITDAPAPFASGDRVRYVPPVGASARVVSGTLRAISGASALVLWDDLGWVGAAPVERLAREGQL